ncbi:MAG: hypothetical protein H6R05_1230 [Burkholderiaceae bacterium]|nr:hypothetical protein [Burkholderiaceae bacterium]
MQEIQTIKPWYKQFWPWMIIGLPTSVVIASVVTYFIALNGIDSVISKDYYKEGLAINTDLSLDKKAAALGLVADVELAGSNITLKLSAQDANALKDMQGRPIQFELENLSFQANNISAVLIPAEAGVWRGKLNGQVSRATWNARVLGGEWRITQRIENTIPTHLILKP